METRASKRKRENTNKNMSFKIVLNRQEVQNCLDEIKQKVTNQIAYLLFLKFYLCIFLKLIPLGF